MELTQLKSFAAVAHEGHMTRAAQRLHVTQPALSAQISKLEDELGQRLFDRTPKGMDLTEAGVTYLRYVEHALATLEEGERALHELMGLERGSLAVGGGATATTYLLPKLIARFHEAHPAIQFFVREQASQGVVEAVIASELDIGIVTTRTGARLPAQLEVHEWVEDELVLIVSKDHALAGQQTFRWSDLEGQPLVLFEAGSAIRNLIDSRLEEAGVNVDIVMELRSIESIKQMVAQGIGAAFVSRFALPDETSGLRASHNAIKRILAVVHRTDRSLSAAARAFLLLLDVTTDRQD